VSVCLSKIYDLTQLGAWSGGVGLRSKFGFSDLRFLCAEEYYFEYTVLFQFADC